MLVGEPGIGKNRTAQELASNAETRGAQVRWGCMMDRSCIGSNGRTRQSRGSSAGRAMWWPGRCMDGQTGRRRRPPAILGCGELVVAWALWAGFPGRGRGLLERWDMVAMLSSRDRNEFG